MFELREILPPEGGLNKRQRCAEGLAYRLLVGESGSGCVEIRNRFLHRGAFARIIVERAQRDN